MTVSEDDFLLIAHPTFQQSCSNKVTPQVELKIRFECVYWLYIFFQTPPTISTFESWTRKCILRWKHYIIYFLPSLQIIFSSLCREGDRTHCWMCWTQERHGTRGVIIVTSLGAFFSEKRSKQIHGVRALIFYLRSKLSKVSTLEIQFTIASQLSCQEIAHPEKSFLEFFFYFLSLWKLFVASVS